MAAYVIVETDITDPEAYERYKAASPGAVAAGGGRFLVRGGAMDVLEGSGGRRGWSSSSSRTWRRPAAGTTPRSTGRPGGSARARPASAWSPSRAWRCRPAPEYRWMPTRTG